VGSATYIILEGLLIPENLVLLDLVLEELGYPEQRNRSVPISVDQEQGRWGGEGEREGKGNLTSFLGWRGRRGRGGREDRRRRRPWRRVCVTGGRSTVRSANDGCWIEDLTSSSSILVEGKGNLTSFLKKKCRKILLLKKSNNFEFN